MTTTNTASDTLPVNATLNLVSQQTTITTLPILPGDVTFLIEHYDIGNIAAHLKYGNIIPYRPPRDINKPLDRLYRKGLSIAHINVNGILHKHRINELKIQLHNKPIDILAISETKVNATILDDRLEIDGYKLYRHDRLSDRGGGVALYIKEDPSMIFKERPELRNNDIECLVCEIFLPKTKPFLIGTFYRPPQSTVSWIHKFETMTDLITLEDKETIFQGDFNVDLYISLTRLMRLEPTLT